MLLLSFFTLRTISTSQTYSYHTTVSIHSIFSTRFPTHLHLINLQLRQIPNPQHPAYSSNYPSFATASRRSQVAHRTGLKFQRTIPAAHLLDSPVAVKRAARLPVAYRAFRHRSCSFARIQSSYRESSSPRRHGERKGSDAPRRFLRGHLSIRGPKDHSCWPIAARNDRGMPESPVPCSAATRKVPTLHEEDSLAGYHLGGYTWGNRSSVKRVPFWGSAANEPARWLSRGTRGQCRCSLMKNELSGAKNKLVSGKFYLK